MIVFVHIPHQTAVKTIIAATCHTCSYIAKNHNRQCAESDGDVAKIKYHLKNIKYSLNFKIPIQNSQFNQSSSFPTTTTHHPN